MRDPRHLSDLDSIGPAMLKDFELLEIRSVSQLAKEDPQGLYEQLCKITRTRHDPCVLDTFCCAVAQARNPELPKEQRKWYWWSRKRKLEEKTLETQAPSRKARSNRSRKL